MPAFTAPSFILLNKWGNDSAIVCVNPHRITRFTSRINDPQSPSYQKQTIIHFGPEDYITVKQGIAEVMQMLGVAE